MAKLDVVEKYNSIHFAVPIGANPDDYSGDEVAHRLALDMATIRKTTEDAGMFNRVSKLYFTDRERMIPKNEDGTCNDATLESHRMTLLTICGEALVDCCEMLNMTYEDTRLNIDVKYIEGDTSNIGGQVSLGVHKDVPDHKRKALYTMFEEFQTKLGKSGIKAGTDAGSIDDFARKHIDDADYKDIENIDVDDITDKA